MRAHFPDRLDLTAGQLWTLGLGLSLGSVLLATSVPAVWERRGLPLAVAVAAAPPAPPTGVALPAPSASAPVVVPTVSVGPAEVLPVLPPAPDALAPPAEPPAGDAPRSGAGSPPSAGPRPSPVAGPVAELRVREGGWTSTSSEPGVPAGGLPVSARLGQQVSTAHLRLMGTSTVLTVALSTAPGASVRPEDARVRACRITTADWRPERPGPAVPFDADDCVDGVLSARTVTFDLADYGDRSGPAGFAVVADLRGSTAPRTFRLILTPDPEDTP